MRTLFTILGWRRVRSVWFLFCFSFHLLGSEVLKSQLCDPVSAAFYLSFFFSPSTKVTQTYSSKETI